MFCLILTSCRSYPGRIRKVGKDFVKEFDFKDIKFIHKVKKNLFSLPFLVIKIRKNIQTMYQKNAVKKTCSFIIDRRRI